MISQDPDCFSLHHGLLSSGPAMTGLVCQSFMQRHRRSPSERTKPVGASPSASLSSRCGAEPSVSPQTGGGVSRASVFLTRSVVSVTQTRLCVAVVKTLSGLDLSHNKGRGTRCSLLSVVPQREPAGLAAVHKFDGWPTINRRLANAATLAKRRNTCTDV